MPAYSGVLSGITFIFGYAATISVSYVAGTITKDHTRQEWREMLFLNCGMLGAGTLLFAIFGRGEPIGDWAKARDFDQEKTDQNSDISTVSVEKF